LDLQYWFGGFLPVIKTMFILIFSPELSGPSHIQITFYEDSFSGMSNESYYPAISNGTYRVFGDSIAIQNLFFFTPNFDYTFIFTGNYAYSSKGDSIYFTRNYGDFTYMPDVYALKKQ
jgi:hypothetical protein